jgi:hypothetical protein
MASIRDRCPTERELSRLAKRVGVEYHQLGIELGVANATIEQIKMEKPHSVADQCLGILLKWTTQLRSRATFWHLHLAMKEVDIDMAALLPEILVHTHTQTHTLSHTPMHTHTHTHSDTHAQ